MKQESLPKKFYINTRRNSEYGVFITIADVDVVENKLFLKKIAYDRIVRESELEEKLKTAISIIFYGENAVELGIRLKYIHPEAVQYQEGVKTAIYIKTF